MLCILPMLRGAGSELRDRARWLPLRPPKANDARRASALGLKMEPHALRAPDSAPASPPLPPSAFTSASAFASLLPAPNAPCDSERLGAAALVVDVLWQQRVDAAKRAKGRLRGEDGLERVLVVVSIYSTRTNRRP